jgi:hypothetical protein
MQPTNVPAKFIIKSGANIEAKRIKRNNKNNTFL